MLTMEMKKREITGNLIFDLEEDISLEKAEEIHLYIMKNLGRETKKVILNIKVVEYINSFALCVLIKIMQELKDKGMDFYLMNASEAVKKLLKITGVMDKFKFYGEK